MILSRKAGPLPLRPHEDSSGPERPAQDQAQDTGAADDGYLPPAVISLGAVWQVTLGSSSSGTADANSHYYW